MFLWLSASCANSCVYLAFPEQCGHPFPPWMLEYDVTHLCSFKHSKLVGEWLFLYGPTSFNPRRPICAFIFSMDSFWLCPQFLFAQVGQPRPCKTLPALAVHLCPREHSKFSFSFELVYGLSNFIPLLANLLRTAS